MQFKPELIEKILVGEKTQTRRPVKDGDWAVHSLPPLTITQVRNSKRCKWRVGRTYAICPGRGKPQVARLELQFIRREDVRFITLEDAVEEGFFSQRGFWQTWCRFYDPLPDKAMYDNIDLFLWLRDRPNDLYDAWVLEFELVQE
jgi:hypothetical protein